jgi:hypothetical protein
MIRSSARHGQRTIARGSYTRTVRSSRDSKKRKSYMSIEEYKNKIRACDSPEQLSSLIGSAFMDAELSTDEYTLVSQMILDKQKRQK